MKKKIALTSFLALSLAVLQGCATVGHIPNPLATPEQLDAERLKVIK